mmetsp:Transcript_39541/g.60395  ORF Transcript_39541/g.60395 Transcript_39541/m.60395 type:complete len:98 (+) Transcript_39541:1241-1534(+)
MTSVDNSAKIGLDVNFAPKFVDLHKKIDQLIENIDRVKEETKEFKEHYSTQLGDKASFYKEQDKWDKPKDDDDIGQSVDPKTRLDQKTMEDIKFGAE